MDDVDTSTNQNQPVQLVAEELHLNGSERNIQIPEVGQMHHSEHNLVSRHHFNIENEALILHGEINLVESHVINQKPSNMHSQFLLVIVENNGVINRVNENQLSVVFS